jgi:3',5'-cyclic AMP phosphodiesterase CpdA
MTDPISRRAAIKTGASTILGLGLLQNAPGAAPAADADFTFVAVNDLHVATPECDPFFAEIARAWKQHAPAFCLVCGDLADDGQPDQLRGARRALDAVGAPCHAVPGNHDLDPSDASRTTYDALFPGQTNYAFTHAGWQFVGLDTTDGTKWKETTIGDATFRWLDANAPSLDPARPTVLFTHFPLGPGTRYRPLNADALLERFRGFDLRAAFCGHWHGLTERTVRNATLTTGACCSRVQKNHDGTDAKGWFLCKVAGGRLTRTFVPLAPTPAAV